ncbi:MAG: hypothetical protein Q6354_05030 [Candidatus Brocadiales bacterium]|nr:hypothetical protein [Candidatus Brocadiales bacterium]
MPIKDSKDFPCIKKASKEGKRNYTMKGVPVQRKRGDMLSVSIKKDAYGTFPYASLVKKNRA